MCAIKTERAADAVAQHIQSLILEGTLRPGQSLLAERELALRLDVSRPTLRDGLKTLVDKGLLTAEGGRGMRVAALGQQAITDPLMNLLTGSAALADDYLEFRDIVESQAAALAAERATDVDLDRIRTSLSRIDNAHAATDAEEEAEADAELHQLIYEATHNLVLLQIMRALSGNLRMDVIHNRGRMFSIADTRKRLHEQHHEIADAIIARDPSRAAQAAHAHLGYVRDCLRHVTEEQAKLDLARRRQAGGGLAASRD
ncbi:FadR/GntR family transcriptional regulator [Paracoccus homiensis]|uniref:Pyruvate dehydrogenase complex repressor n=1 Tax=Paracoccus homiensis TaxID=364199 RepID=A0A1I0DRT1_9RHOB|nr:FCD domain-containing protein [Paracoccus homiensis]SET34992.1 transcriptional regulator, GntR family [Paracoccus homiensis]